MAPRNKLSDSESDGEPDVAATPSDSSLEKALRDEVAGIFKSGNMEELTMKRIRLAVEKKVGLTEGYFKQTGDWKKRSEEIVKAEVDKQQNAENDNEQAPKSPSASPPPKKAAPKRSKKDTVSKPRKRQKTQTPVSEDEDEKEEESKPEPADDESEEDMPEPKKPAPRPATKSKSKAASDDSEGETRAQEEDTPMDDAKADSESEMSVVLDNEPQPKPARKRKSGEAAKKEKKKPAPKSKGKDEDVDPDQAEIKRLQGWLVKCGIRKMWFRELAPYDTAKEKIKHLKGMLTDAGMTGRYSQEKANKIRDERELKADLEQIQQGARQWGADSNDEGKGDDAEATPPRRVPRGRQALAFLESDGEETD